MASLRRCTPCNADGKTLAMRKRITRDTQQKLIVLLAGGVTLCEAAAHEGIKKTDLMCWLAKDTQFARAVETARKSFVDVNVERLHDLALELVEKAQLGMLVTQKQISTVKIYGEVVKWLAERVHRDKYGTHVKHDIIGLKESEDKEAHTVWVDP